MADRAQKEERCVPWLEVGDDGRNAERELTEAARGEACAQACAVCGLGAAAAGGESKQSKS